MMAFARLILTIVAAPVERTSGFFVIVSSSAPLITLSEFQTWGDKMTVVLLRAETK